MHLQSVLVHSAPLLTNPLLHTLPPLTHYLYPSTEIPSIFPTCSGYLYSPFNFPLVHYYCVLKGKDVLFLFRASSFLLLSFLASIYLQKGRIGEKIASTLHIYLTICDRKINETFTLSPVLSSTMCSYFCNMRNLRDILNK